MSKDKIEQEYCINHDFTKTSKDSTIFCEYCEGFDVSHTFVAKSGNRYFHNGDFSGNITFPYPMEEIPFQDLLELVGKYVRFQRCEYVEAYRALDIDISEED